MQPRPRLKQNDQNNHGAILLVQHLQTLRNSGPEVIEDAGIFVLKNFRILSQNRGELAN